MPGPPKKPTAILKLRGSWRGTSRPSEPQVESSKIPCPSWVSATAKKYWDEIATVLAGMQVSTVADCGAMVLLVDALSQYVHARNIVDEEGITTEGSVGNTVAHPAVGIRDAAWARAMKAMVQFGMTPSSRAAVTTSKKKDDKPDGKSRFFKPAG